MINLDFLKQIMPRFEEFLETDLAKQWEEDRKQKDIFIKEYLSKEAIDNIDEGVLRDLIHHLWSFAGWTNFDWLLEQMMESGLPKIKQKLKDLLHSEKPIEVRFDAMREIKMVGAASISEILAQWNPMKYAIYNRRSKAGLIKLGVDPKLLPKSSQINGSQYLKFCNLVQSVFKEINKMYPEINDLLKLDFLLHYLATEYEEMIPPSSEMEIKEEFDHDDVVDQVLQLGDGLGFDVKKEYYITKGCKIDAIWRTRVANLGSVAYAFEVHRKGSRDSAILNLQRCKKDPSIQKVIIVSTKDEIEKFKEEISALPEDFRESVGYFNVNDLQKALEQLNTLREILASIGLLKSSLK